MTGEPGPGVSSESPAHRLAAVGAEAAVKPASQRTARAGRRRIPTEARFVAAALLAALLGTAMYAVAVATEVGQRMENFALRGAELRSTAEREAASELLSGITVATFALVGAGVWVTGVLTARGGLATLAVLTMAVSVGTAELLKVVLPRPELVSGPRWLLDNSFPSGSAAVAVSIAVGALLVAPNRLRWVVLPAGALVAATVAYAVQAIGWHRLSDTLGATFFVVTIASLALVLLARAGLVHRSDGGRIDRRIWQALLFGGATALVLGAALAVLPIAFPLLMTPVGARRAFLQAAFPLVGAGAAGLVLLAFGRLIEPFSLGRTERVSPSDSGGEP